MNSSHYEIYDKLSEIYKKHKYKYRYNPDSKQMCCMWSTTNPPETIVDTEPIYDLEDAFDISLNDDDCMELYDMELKDASAKIADIIKQQHKPLD